MCVLVQLLVLLLLLPPQWRLVVDEVEVGVGVGQDGSEYVRVTQASWQLEPQVNFLLRRLYRTAGEEMLTLRMTERLWELVIRRS